MGWEINNAPPNSLSAVYYLVLPTDFKVLFSYELNNSTPMEYAGNFQQFTGSQPHGTPFIPLDTHHALLLEWVDMDTMARNRPYLDDAIKAAIALVA